VFNLSGSEIVVILLLALVVLGPEKLPDAMRRFGRVYGELKRMSSSFQEEMRSTLEEPMREMRDTADMIRGEADFTKLAPEKPTSGNPMEEGLADDDDVDEFDDDDEFDDEDDEEADDGEPGGNRSAT
jgi:sec-independent protein translocase protein TatB